MENIIQQIADKSVNEINQRIDKIINWQVLGYYGGFKYK